MIGDYLKSNEYEKAKPLITGYKNNSEFNQSALTLVLYRYPDYNEKILKQLSLKRTITGG
jgi:hypothetical protein